MWDVDGREYTDFSMCFGALMVGHSHPTMVQAIARAASEGTLYGMPHDREVRAAELICERFGLEQMRFTNSGSESTMHALRLARAYTGRDKVLKFEGAYHGGHDSVLVSVKPPRPKVGHLRHPKANPVGHGIPALTVENTLVAQWNDARSVREVLERNENDVAALILEPVMMNVGVIGPRDGFLQELRELCNEFGCLLIFDEVKTGAKLAWGGAQERYRVKADIVCLAKAIGGGLHRAGIIAATILVTAFGGLCEPKLPDISGMAEFAGQRFHTARWNHDCDVAGKRVAIIGTGASAIQIIPEIAATAGHLDVYQARHHGFCRVATGHNTKFERAAFRRVPGYQATDTRRHLRPAGPQFTRLLLRAVDSEMGVPAGRPTPGAAD